MAYEQGSLARRSIPRVSRLPRTATSAVPEVHDESLERTSGLPRPSVSASLRMKSTGPLSENINKAGTSRFGFKRQISRNQLKSPVQDAFPATQSASLETTPPSNHAARIVDNEDDENASAFKPAGEDPVANVADVRRRKPRPSLSERTIETLSQIPPSPSPSRKRGSSTSTAGSMGPPTRSTPSVTVSRATTPSRTRPSSPQKPAFRHPGNSMSPTKDIPPIPAIPSFDRIYTPPRALVKEQGSRIALPSRSATRSASTTTSKNQIPQTQPKQVPHGHKVKSMYNLRAAAAKSNTPKPSLDSLFKDPPKPPTQHGELQLAGLERSSGLLKPRSPGENALAPTNHKKKQATSPCPKVMAQEARKLTTLQQQQSPKSSAALRDTIAKAKAAKRQAMSKTQDSTSDDYFGLQRRSSSPEIFVPTTISDLSLQKRIDNAVTTGVLNLAALRLKEVPEQLLRMYDFDENSKVSWSEAVDMTKLLASDNEFESISETLFPDWSMEELAEDDEKSNIFGGLEILDLHGNNLTELPIGLRRLERLHTLNLSNNKLTMDAIDVIRHIPNLREVNLANNNLSGTLCSSLSGLQKLRSLDIHGNEISQLPDTISKCQNLQKLNISDNNLSVLPVNEIKDLGLLDLDVSQNQLAGNLGLVGLQQLQNLSISGNQLEELFEEKICMSKLQTLVIDNNRLRTIPDVSRLSNLVTFTASGNRLEQLPLSFGCLSSLRNANFSNNNLKTLDPSLSRLENLTALNISGNPLRERKYLSMNTDDLKADLKRRLDPVESLGENDMAYSEVDTNSYLSTNRSTSSKYLYTPTSGQLNLSSLSLSSIDIDQIDLAQPIHTIRLSNNELTSLPLTLLSHPSVQTTLRSLDISHNQHLHPTSYLSSPLSLPNLQSLYIVSTGLTSLSNLTTHLSAPCLVELNISCHRLTGDVPHLQDWFPRLTTLLATDNWFTSIDVAAVRGLEVLDIRNNEIESLPPKIGELGINPDNDNNNIQKRRLRSFECTGNRFRVPRLAIVEKGTEAVLRDLRRMVPIDEVGEEWR